MNRREDGARYRIRTRNRRWGTRKRQRDRPVANTRFEGSDGDSRVVRRSPEGREVRQCADRGRREAWCPGSNIHRKRRDSTLLETESGRDVRLHTGSEVQYLCDNMTTTDNTSASSDIAHERRSKERHHSRSFDDVDDERKYRHNRREAEDFQTFNHLQRGDSDEEIDDDDQPPRTKLSRMQSWFPPPPSTYCNSASSCGIWQEGNISEEQRVKILTGEDLDTMTPESRDDLAGMTLWVLCDYKQGTAKLGQLLEAVADHTKIQFPSKKTFKDFLDTYSGTFCIQDHAQKTTDIHLPPEDGEILENDKREEDDIGDITVSGIPDLKLCSDHSTKVGSCGGKCEQLHVCKYFLLSECTIEKACMFGHDMDTDHNKWVIRKAFLQNCEPSVIKKLVTDLRFRNISTMPVVCTFYNSERGCNKGNKCPYLHTCSLFIEGLCNRGRKCRYSHDMEEPQPSSILRKHGINPENKEEFFTAMRRVSTESLNRKTGRKRYINTATTLTLQAQNTNSTTYTHQQRTVVEAKEGLPLTMVVDVASPKRQDYSNELSVELESDGPISTWKWQYLHESGFNQDWCDKTLIAGKDVEEKYRQFCKARYACVEIHGKIFKIDFLNMKGSFEEGTYFDVQREKILADSSNEKEAL